MKFCCRPAYEVATTVPAIHFAFGGQFTSSDFRDEIIGLEIRDKRKTLP